MTRHFICLTFACLVAACETPAAPATVETGPSLPVQPVEPVVQTPLPAAGPENRMKLIEEDNLPTENDLQPAAAPRPAGPTIIVPPPLPGNP